MTNLSTIGGAALWVTVSLLLMLAALTPVDVNVPASHGASGTAQVETSARAPA